MLQLETQPASPRSFTISAVVHAIAIALLVTIHFAPAEMTKRVLHVALLAPSPEPAPHIAKVPRPRVFRPVVPAPKRIEPKVVLDAPPAIALPRPALPLAPETPRIAAAAPPMKIDNLAEIHAAPAPAPPKIALQPAGFSAAETSPGKRPRATASTGAFESAETAHAAAPRSMVRSGAFSSVAAEHVESVRRSISSGAFGDTVVAQAAPARIETRPAAAIPLEILFKPKPAYSAEAQRLRIEGEVELEIVFAASGQPRVLRVVRGLGHGLDENAIDAARGIRFRPAQADGRAVDSTAIVHIVFELAY